MRQLVVFLKLIVLTASLAAGASSAEQLGFQKQSVSLAALSEAVTLSSDFDGEPEQDEPADLASYRATGSNNNPNTYQFDALSAQTITTGLPQARGPPLNL